MAEYHKIHKKRVWLLVLLIIIALVGGVVGGYFLRGYVETTESTQEETKVDYAQLTKDLRAQKDSADDSDLTQNIGNQYDESLAELRRSDPSVWKQEDIDKAYFSILYADSIDAYSQVQTIYYLLMAAERAGVDITTNGANVTAEERDTIMGRATQSE
jgi:hypothetical protein